MLYRNDDASPSKPNEQSNVPNLTSVMSRIILDDPSSTLRAKTKAQVKLGYTQTNATLTWQNLRFEGQEGVELYPLSGYIKPKQMLCFLGGGDFSGINHAFNLIKDPIKNLHSSTTANGEILMNGIIPGKFYGRTLSYIPKTDNHIATLTVKETLVFSAKMRLPAHIEKPHLYDSVDTVLGWLGLTKCQNTFVGDANLKGISGGQKRRLSVGVEVVSGYSILLADVPTNGLDAQTALSLVESCKKVCDAGKSMIMKVVQPSPELFQVFDNCCIMSYGQCLYFGPVSEVEAYFLKLGLIRPNNKSLPAWIEEFTVKPQEYCSAELKSKLEQKGINFSNELAIIRYLSQRFSKSSYCADLSKEVMWKHLEEPEADAARGRTVSVSSSPKDKDSEVCDGHEAGSKRKPSVGDDQTTDHHDSPRKTFVGYDQTFDLRGLDQGFVWSLPKLQSSMYQIKHITQRTFLATFRNKPYLIARLFQAIVVAVAMSLLFWQLDMSDANMRSRIALLFFIVGFMGFGAVPFIPNLSTQLRVFEVQKQAKYFHVYSFYIAQILVELPLTFIETLLFMLISYPAIGLSSTIFCIAVFFVMTFLVRFTSWSFCMFITGFCKDASVSQIVATMLLPIGYAFNGFLIPTKEGTYFAQILSKLSFFTYPFQILANSQLKSLNNKDADKWLKNFQVEGTTDDFPLAIFLTLMWFAVFNFFAYLTLCRTDTLSKKTKNAHDNTIISHVLDMASTIVDCFTCGKFQCKLNRTKKRNDAIKSHISLKLKAHRKRSSTNGSHKNDTIVEVSENEDAKENDSFDLPATYLEWKDLSYTVPLPDGSQKQLLYDINGYVRPGDMVALMGPSGAGKSTLLDVLALKKNVGKIDGEFLLNGEKPNKFYSRMIGYVEQFDSHMPSLTVEEAIKFSANLRLQSNVSQKQKDQIVESIMNRLGIMHIKNKKIGSYGNGISNENKKKVTIAVELVAQPGLIFLDEPTTGLDSGAAFNVMKTVHTLAKEQNVSVICTIHQPSAEVFQLFNRILLLEEGGKTVFFGNAEDLEKYYEKYGFGKKTPVEKNPADWAIEAIHYAPQDDESTTTTTTPKTANDIWKQTQEFKELEMQVSDKIAPENAAVPQFESFYATSFGKQLIQMTCRGWKFFSRDTQGLFFRFFTSSLMGICLGLLYYNVMQFDTNKGSAEEIATKQRVLQNALISMLYVTVVYASESCAQEIPLFVSERAMMYREVDSKMYSIVAYYLGRVFAQLPLILLQSLLFSVPFWFMTYYNGPMETQLFGQVFFEYYLGVFVMLSTATTFCQMLAVSTPNEGVGNVLYTTMCTLCRLFGGFLIKLHVMLSVTRFFNGFDFFKYALFYFAGTHLKHWQNGDEKKGVAVYKSFIQDQMIPHESIELNKNELHLRPFVYLLGLSMFLLGFHIISIAMLKWKRWDKR